MPDADSTAQVMDALESVGLHRCIAGPGLLYCGCEPGECAFSECVSWDAELDAAVERIAGDEG